MPTRSTATTRATPEQGSKAGRSAARAPAAVPRPSASSKERPSTVPRPSPQPTRATSAPPSRSPAGGSPSMVVPKVARGHEPSVRPPALAVPTAVAHAAKTAKPERPSASPPKAPSTPPRAPIAATAKVPARSALAPVTPAPARTIVGVPALDGAAAKALLEQTSIDHQPLALLAAADLGRTQAMAPSADLLAKTTVAPTAPDLAATSMLASASSSAVPAAPPAPASSSKLSASEELALEAEVLQALAAAKAEEARASMPGPAWTHEIPSNPDYARARAERAAAWAAPPPPPRPLERPVGDFTDLAVIHPEGAEAPTYAVYSVGGRVSPVPPAPVSSRRLDSFSAEELALERRRQMVPLALGLAAMAALAMALVAILALSGDDDAPRSTVRAAASQVQPAADVAPATAAVEAEPAGDEPAAPAETIELEEPVAPRAAPPRVAAPRSSRPRRDPFGTMH